MWVDIYVTGPVKTGHVACKIELLFQTFMNFVDHLWPWYVLDADIT